MKQIIKGAIYTDGDMLLRPFYSGDFVCVDCTKYKTKDQIMADYSETTAEEMLNNTCLTYEGNEYYECEYSLYDTDSMELLSDMDKLEFYDEETEF